MDDQSTIQIELTRLVAVYLGRGMSASSIGLELLTLGIVMLANGDDFRRLAAQATSPNLPLETGYSAIG
jgi:hypothetical protein